MRSTAVRWRALVILIAGLLVYSNSLSSPFLFDDINSIVGNRQIRQLVPLSVPLSPPRDTPVAGRPLVNLTFAINYAVGGLNPWGYHLANVVIHVIAALVLFGLVRRTNACGHPSTNVALVGALLWMLHPLNTEAVNYLSQRTESMMGLLYLFTLYCSVRRWNIAAVIACAAGMMCKESMVTAPVVVMLYDRVFVFGSWQQMTRARGGFYVALAGTWLALAMLMSSTPRTSIGFGAGVSALVYLLNQFEMIARYLRLAIWPSGLVLDYGLPRPLAFGDVLPQAALVITLAAATVVALVRWPRVGFLAAVFFITLAPTSSIVPIATEVGAERRMYLPLAALVVMFVAAIAPIAGGAQRARRWGAVAAAACLCVLLAAATVVRNREYASTRAMAQTIVDRWPSGRGHYLLGTELLAAGRHDAGMAELELSEADYPGARYALGTELLAAGRIDAAIGELQAFIAALPTHANVAPARDMLGRAYASQRRFELAAEQLERLLADYPAYPARDEVRRLIVQIRDARFRRS